MMQEILGKLSTSNLKASLEILLQSIRFIDAFDKGDEKNREKISGCE